MGKSRFQDGNTKHDPLDDCDRLLPHHLLRRGSEKGNQNKVHLIRAHMETQPGRIPSPPVPRMENVPLPREVTGFVPLRAAWDRMNSYSGVSLAALHINGWEGRMQTGIPNKQDIIPYFNPQKDRQYIVLTVRDMHYGGKDPDSSDPRHDILVTEESFPGSADSSTLVVVYDYPKNPWYAQTVKNKSERYLRILGVYEVNRAGSEAREVISEDILTRHRVGVKALSPDSPRSPIIKDTGHASGTLVPQTKKVSAPTAAPYRTVLVEDASAGTESWLSRLQNETGIIRARERIREEIRAFTGESTGGQSADRRYHNLLQRLPWEKMVEDYMRHGSGNFERLSDRVVSALNIFRRLSGKDLQYVKNMVASLQSLVTEIAEETAVSPKKATAS